MNSGISRTFFVHFPQDEEVRELELSTLWVSEFLHPLGGVVTEVIQPSLVCHLLLPPPSLFERCTGGMLVVLCPSWEELHPELPLEVTTPLVGIVMVLVEELRLCTVLGVLSNLCTDSHILSHIYIIRVQP
jgi:hypothetical protein